MTVKMKELSHDEENTLAARLRTARDDAGLTRAEAHKRTGIPAKSLEKFELGSQEPNVTRIKTMSEIYGVTVNWLLGIEDISSLGSVNDALGPSKSIDSEPSPPTAKGIDDDPISTKLGLLDEMRLSNFDGITRQAMALTDEIQSLFSAIEPGDLVEVWAVKRGLFSGECLDAPSILDIFRNDVEEAQEYCGNVQERILDTAILGVDLYAYELKTLNLIADSLEIEKPEFSFYMERDFNSHEEVIPEIRPVLRSMAYSGNGFDFTDPDLEEREKELFDE